VQIPRRLRGGLGVRASFLVARRGLVPSFRKALLSVFLFAIEQRVLPSETGNPQELHFCTRCIASGTAAGADAAAVASEGMDDAAGGPSANSGGRQIAGIVCSFGALLTLARSGKTSEGFPDSRLATGAGAVPTGRGPLR